MTGARECATCDECPPRRWQVGATRFRTCPTRHRRSSAWQQVVACHNAAQVSPLTGWPDTYAAWVVDALSALSGALHAAHMARLNKGQR